MTGWVMLNSFVRGVEKTGGEDGMLTAFLVKRYEDGFNGRTGSPLQGLAVLYNRDRVRFAAGKRSCGGEDVGECHIGKVRNSRECGERETLRQRVLDRLPVPGSWSPGGPGTSACQLSSDPDLCARWGPALQTSVPSTTLLSPPLPQTLVQ